MNYPVMPMSTALWLVKNTILTFFQIAKLCKLHELEIWEIISGRLVQNTKSINPFVNKQLIPEKIKYYELQNNIKLDITKQTNKKEKKIIHYTSKINAVIWLVKSYPKILDKEVSTLLHVTKSTIRNIRLGVYNYKQFYPKNPIKLGICNQYQLYYIHNLIKKRNN